MTKQITLEISGGESFSLQVEENSTGKTVYMTANPHTFDLTEGHIHTYLLRVKGVKGNKYKITISNAAICNSPEEREIVLTSGLASLSDDFTA